MCFNNSRLRQARAVSFFDKINDLLGKVKVADQIYIRLSKTCEIQCLMGKYSRETKGNRTHYKINFPCRQLASSYKRLTFNPRIGRGCVRCALGPAPVIIPLNVTGI